MTENPKTPENLPVFTWDNVKTLPIESKTQDAVKTSLEELALVNEKERILADHQLFLGLAFGDDLFVRWETNHPGFIEYIYRGEEMLCDHVPMDNVSGYAFLESITPKLAKKGIYPTKNIL